MNHSSHETNHSCRPFHSHGARLASIALVLLVVLISIFPVSAAGETADFIPSAVELAPGWDDDLAAQRLSLLQFFHGTRSGYELDRAPSRAEAAAMLVRLLGREKEAVAAAYAHPFKDVPSWANTYVGYLWHAGLTKGISATKFGSQSVISSAAYGTMLLRALGHEESASGYAWTESIDMLEEVGIVDGAEADRLSDLGVESRNGVFTRGDMAVLSYRSLLAPVRDDGRLLLETFAADGLVPSMTIDGGLLAAGMPAAQVIVRFGLPSRVDPTLEGDDLYVYNGDLFSFFMVSIRSGMVVSMTSNASRFQLGGRFGPGSLLTDVYRQYAAAGSSMPGNEYASVRATTNAWVFCYNDPLAVTKLSAVKAVLKNAYGKEREADALTLDEQTALKKAFAWQTLDLANAVRFRLGFTPFTWDERAAKSAEAHSADMAVNDYFDHDALNGDSPFERMETYGIRYSSASENIAAGHSDAFRTHEAWMHSEGHRNNLLGDTERMGAGVAFGGYYGTYCTQDFFTPYG